MGRQSAGILLYRFGTAGLEVLLVHPGGPLHAKKDLGAWSIPKGEYSDDEDALSVAKREFEEETGYTVPSDNFTALTPVIQKGHKKVCAWAAEGNIDSMHTVSNTFKMEWPPRSGKWQEFPEVDKAEWFPVQEAVHKINPVQAALIDELVTKLHS